MPNMTLAAVAVQRRSIAIALFRRTHLEEVLVRQLPTEAIKAGNSLVGFLRQVLERHPIEVAAFEVADDEGTRIHQYLQQVEDILRPAGVPLFKIPQQELFRSFAVSPLRRKDPLRRIVRSIWPILNSQEFGHAALDAAALGLHVQTERLFTIKLPQQ
jgi:hypothetical protein